MSKSGLLSFDAHLTELEAAKKQASRKNPSHLDFIDKFMLPSLDFGVACKNMTGSSGFCHRSALSVYSHHPSGSPVK
jgi:hypothetical protein